MPGDERRCRSGRHVIPPVLDRCPECRRERDTARHAGRAYPQFARQCAAGLHVIPAGEGRCQPCKQRNAQTLPDRERTAVLLREAHLPPKELLGRAACTLDDASLFDVGAPKHAKAAEDARHARAKAICAGCPVVAQCFADGYAGRQLGVYGGVVMDAGYWSMEGKRRNALVQSVPSVQDSPAC